MLQTPSKTTQTLLSPRIPRARELGLHTILKKYQPIG